MKLLFCILFLCYLCSTSQAGKLPLIGNAAFQDEHCEKKEAKLAIDGKVDTFSMCASDGDPTARGSWQVDLGGNYKIGQVIVTASSDINYAKYLQVFSIWLIDENNIPYLCYNYSSTEHLAPSEIRSFPCENDQNSTRYVRIARDGGKFRPDAIALAEVNVMTGLPPSKIEVDGDEIQLAGKNAIQSNTWNNANLAIDGNLKTCTDTRSQYTHKTDAIAWWQLDLGGMYDVGKVILTSCNFEKNFILRFTLIFLKNDTKSMWNCNDIMSTPDVVPSETRPFQCLKPVVSRYIYIRQDFAFALAEVKVKTRSSYFNITPTSEFRTEIPLAGKITSQSKTLGKRISYLATDGNMTTFSVAESPGDNLVLGWWEVDLGGIYQVGEVFITSSIEKQYAEYLNNFSIWLLDKDRTKHLCKSYISSESFNTQETRSFLCDNEPFMTTYVRIAKLDGSPRKDAIALADVRVMSGFHKKN